MSDTLVNQPNTVGILPKHWKAGDESSFSGTVPVLALTKNPELEGVVKSLLAVFAEVIQSAAMTVIHPEVSTTKQIDTALAELTAQKSAWLAVSVIERIQILDEIARRISMAWQSVGQ